MQLVVHAPFGSRINRAWGLALRKRFCVGFGFELQAAANEEAIVLSLGPQHSFPLEEVFDYLHPATARGVLVQALLAAPMFGTRWRWNAQRSLLLDRARNGKRLPAALVRMKAEDLLAAAFPQALACPETLPGGPIEVPDDHPIVRQTVEDCLTEAMDADGFLEVLDGAAGRLDRASCRRHARALGLRARDPLEPALHLPRRRAARGAPHPGGDGAPRARPARGGRDRRARPRRDRARARGGVASPRERRGGARGASLDGLRDGRGGARLAGLDSTRSPRRAASSAWRTAGSRSRPRGTQGGAARAARGARARLRGRRARTRRRSSCSSRPRASCCASASTGAPPGATAGCSRASTATPSIACAARSSR